MSVASRKICRNFHGTPETEVSRCVGHCYQVTTSRKYIGDKRFSNCEDKDNHDSCASTRIVFFSSLSREEVTTSRMYIGDKRFSNFEDKDNHDSCLHRHELHFHLHQPRGYTGIWVKSAQRRISEFYFVGPLAGTSGRAVPFISALRLPLTRSWWGTEPAVVEIAQALPSFLTTQDVI